MSVYFVTCRAANAVKIGYSVEPVERLPEIQWGCPLPLTLEAVMPGDTSEERRLHGWFADDRLMGEWFTLTMMIEEIIKANSVPHVTGMRRGRKNPKPHKKWHRKSEAEKYQFLIAERRAAEDRKRQEALAEEHF